MSEGLHYAARKQSDKAYAAGYDKGKSDAVKQQYWLYVSMQRQRNQVGQRPPLSRATAGRGDVPTIHKTPPHVAIDVGVRDE